MHTKLKTKFVDLKSLQAYVNDVGLDRQAYDRIERVAIVCDHALQMAISSAVFDVSLNNYVLAERLLQRIVKLLKFAIIDPAAELQKILSSTPTEVPEWDDDDLVPEWVPDDEGE